MLMPTMLSLKLKGQLNLYPFKEETNAHYYKPNKKYEAKG